MSTLRIWILGVVVVAIAIIGLGYFLGIAPRLADAAAADAERQNVEIVNAGYEATLVELQALAENLPALEAELADLRVSIPDEPGLSPLLGQLSALAAAAGVELNDVTASPPALFPAEALEGFPIDALVVLPVSISATGTDVALSDFLESVQFGDRLVLVEQFDISGAPDSSRVTIQGFVFVVPPEGASLPTEEATGEAPADGAPIEEAPADEAPAEG